MQPRRRPHGRLAVLFLGALLAGPLPLAAQSVLLRPPNMHGTWVGPSGTVHFNFLHRFSHTGEPLRKVINYPTFLMGAGIGGDGLVGVRYATNSELVTGIPNEWEAFLRYTPLTQPEGRPLDLSVHAGWNDAARSGDVELTLGRSFGERLRLLVAGRGFSNAFDTDEARFAWAVGGTLQLHRWVALAGDYAELLDREEVPRAEAAWSAGLQLAVPFTPHTLSLQASNATTTTLQGSSLGVSETRWGFEFTVPLTLSRYFGGRAGSGPTGGSGGPVAAEVGMTNALTFTPDTVRVRVGETVRWRNDSQVLHTVTADPARVSQASNVALPAGAAAFDSGDMRPGDVFEQTFTVVGTYQYVCLPHEMAGMIGWVIVTE